jgi:hypothetical protein
VNTICDDNVPPPRSLVPNPSVDTSKETEWRLARRAGLQKVRLRTTTGMRSTPWGISSHGKIKPYVDAEGRWVVRESEKDGGEKEDKTADRI